METTKFTVVNEEGIHARPANEFTKAAMKFKCSLKLYKNDNEAKVYNPKSILSVISMGAVRGDTITVVAEGEDEAEAITQILTLAKNAFNEQG